MAKADEVWQHDSSFHQWWPASEKQTLLRIVMIIQENYWALPLFPPTPLGIISSGVMTVILALVFAGRLKFSQGKGFTQRRRAAEEESL